MHLMTMRIAVVVVAAPEGADFIRVGITERQLMDSIVHKYGERVDDAPGVDSDSPLESTPRRLTGVAALKLHVSLLVGLALCAVAFWFEIGRAERGNSLSWAYVFEWPLLGIFGIYMWWNLLHEGHTGIRRHRAPKPAIAPEYEGMLAAWQEHQRELAAAQASSSADGDEASATSDGQH